MLRKQCLDTGTSLSLKQYLRLVGPRSSTPLRKEAEQTVGQTSQVTPSLEVVKEIPRAVSYQKRQGLRQGLSLLAAHPLHYAPDSQWSFRPQRPQKSATLPKSFQF